jgi:hypothetical protein
MIHAAKRAILFCLLIPGFASADTAKLGPPQPSSHRVMPQIESTMLTALPLCSGDARTLFVTDGMGTNDKPAAKPPQDAGRKVESGTPAEQPSDPPDAPQPDEKGITWGATIRQSLLFLGIEHSFRLATEQGTRDELKGPFFRDWFRSVRNLRGWRDGDPFFVNYIGHPMQGAVSGYILIQNDPRGRKLELSDDRKYWRSRFKAFGWNMLYSTQFELGPLSECSIGNVGLKPVHTSRHPQAYVDLVITPVVGTAWLIGEDALDKYVVRPLENRTDSHAARILIRSLFNPARSFANAMRGRWFWHRDDRPGVSHF